MNIICDKTLLSAAIDGVSKAVTLRSTIPVLEGILLKAEGFQLTLTGYDLEMGIVTTIDANVKEPGEVVLNAKLLSSMVRSVLPVLSPRISLTQSYSGKMVVTTLSLLESLSPVSAAFFLPQPASRPTAMVSTRNRGIIFFIV